MDIDSFRLLTTFHTANRWDTTPSDRLYSCSSDTDTTENTLLYSLNWYYNNSLYWTESLEGMVSWGIFFWRYF